MTRTSDNEVIRFRGTLGAETDKAIQMYINGPDGSSTKRWFPLSQVVSKVNSRHRAQDTITIKRWIADKDPTLFDYEDPQEVDNG